ncbi:30S ribosomal protein S16 [Nesterenkonia haasae]|uniref:30S ribosomal protein S16 n=1 Tax=Nesterenkonia haasae TaxID=2587813 RepID=UPI001391913D|nr:30S ribosomal protein S16 [Nesterenkonia haasae]NDK30723.1 30S ribosomal protein S16 [Nesterenkonia haasae]
MAVKIRLKRMGKKFAPQYRVVVADSRVKRDGKSIEEIGKYQPTEEPSFIEIQSERAQYWLSVGAQPTEQVKQLLTITGDWQKFKGLEGSEGTLKTRAPKEEFTAPTKGSVVAEKTNAAEQSPAEAGKAAAEESSEEKTEA